MWGQNDEAIDYGHTPIVQEEGRSSGFRVISSDDRLRLQLGFMPNETPVGSHRKAEIFATYLEAPELHARDTNRLSLIQQVDFLACGGLMHLATFQRTRDSLKGPVLGS